MIPVPPVVSAEQPLPIVVNTSFELVCNVSGLDPPDSITWSFNSMELFTGDATTGGNFTVFFMNDDFGAYTCTASNDFGTDNVTINVMQAGMVHEQCFSKCGKFHGQLLLRYSCCLMDHIGVN